MSPQPPADEARIRGLMILFTFSAFIVAGSIHYQTPMLATIADQFGVDAATAGWIPAASFAGMLIGIVFLVPLGDRIDKRRIILGKLVTLCIAQVAMGFAPNIAALALASLVSGVCSSLIQHMMAIITDLSRPSERGRNLGTLFTALFLGILFARIVGGVIATHLGWRASYALSVTLLLVLLPLLVRRLPHTRPTTQVAYRALLWSLVGLMREHAVIRRVAAIQFLMGLCYGGFWAVVAPMLAVLHRIGPTQAGLIGIPGAAGALVARPAGQWMDRAGARPVVIAGICSMLVAWFVFGFAVWTLIAVVAGAVLLDCGLRATMVANQTLVSTLVPEARSRAITVFAMNVWGGNAIGAWIAANVFARFGWLAVCALAITFSSLALAIHLSGDRTRPPGP